MIRKIIQLFPLFFVLAAFVSCDCLDDECFEASGDETEQGISLRIIPDKCALQTINAETVNQLGSLSITIKDADGNLIFQKSFTRKELSSSMTVSGIDDVDAATITLSGFGEDPNVVKWSGQVSGLSFKKGKKTSIQAVLYPTLGTACMPDPLKTPRFGHSATLLQDGRILIAGGFSSCNATKCVANKSVEIIDVESGEVELLADLSENRAMHEAVLLSDGSVLIFGGVKTLDIGTQSYEDYPTTPYSFSIQATLIEKYTPLYPKFNMRMNKSGFSIENTTENITIPQGTISMPFLPFQSYFVQTLTENKKTVYLAGGVASDGKPSDKIYAFDIFDTNDSVNISAIREIAPVEKDSMLMPAVGISGGSFFTAGGRSKNAAASASFYSDSSTAWEGSGPNLFYAANLMIDNVLYTFGGLENKGDETLSDNKYAHRWNIAEKTITKTSKELTSWGKSVFFSDVVYDQKNGHFIIIGGAGGSQSNKDRSGGSNIYQVIKKDGFIIQDKPFLYPMNYGRILPKAVIDSNNRMFITGGTSQLGSSGFAVGAIEINNL